MKTRDLQPRINYFKSDVFTLAMVIMELALGEDCSDCYDYV